MRRDDGSLDTLSPDPRGSAPPPNELAQGARLGRYIVLERIGAGAMGVVYGAYDPSLGRNVALKVLREAGGADRPGRLLREAHALARLAHPNVVAVHDVGTADGQVFIAMELISGTNLRAWLAERPRSWREVLDVFLQAGRGLAAAHALGVVHRDFKPENAVLDKQGRVRVLDFGLARAEAAAPDVAPVEPPGASAVADTLTSTGLIVGTPAYAAPEQLRGRSDARADQYSFGVALHEALLGGRPGSERAGARAPGWILAVVRRTLSRDPDERYPSMEAVLAALARDPRARWRPIAAVGLAVGALAAAGLILARRPDVCGGAGERIAGLWEGERRETARRAFTATELPYAGAVFASIDGALSRYRDGWTAMYTEACESGRVRGEQSQQVLDLRMECLAQRRLALDGMTAALARADGKTVDRAVAAAVALPALDDCADVATLRAPVPPPDDATVRAQVADLRARLASARALQAAGRFAEAMAIAAPAAELAVATRHRPIEAEALYLLGSLQHDTGEDEAAVASLIRAHLAATAGRHGLVAADAAILLVRIVGWEQAQYPQAHEWAARAGAALEAVGPNPRLVSQLDNNLGVLLYAQDRYDESIVYHQAALAMRVAAFGRESQPVAASYSNLGISFGAKGQNAIAAEQHRLAIAIVERVLGEGHPTTASMQSNLGAVLNDMGDYPAGLAVYRHALEVGTRTFGPTHLQVASYYTGMGVAHYGLGHWTEALEAHRQALAIKEKALGPENPSVATSLANTSKVLIKLGQLDEAAAMAERAVAIVEKRQGPGHSDVAHAVMAVAEIAFLRGRLDEARAAYQKAADIFARAGGPDNPFVGDALAGVGQVALAQGRFGEAEATLDRALAIAEGRTADREKVARMRILLAEAHRRR